MRFLQVLVGAALGLSMVGAACARPSDAQVVKRAEALSQKQIEGSHNVAALRRLGGIYHSAGDKQRFRWTLKRLTQLRPGSLNWKLDLAASYAADDMKTPAYDILLRMKGQGFGVDLSKDPRFSKIHGTQVWGYLVGNLKQSLKPFGKGKSAFTLDRKGLLIEAIGYDPARQRFVLGSASDGHVYLADKHGKLHDFIAPDAKNHLWAVMDLAVDAKRNRLWVATTSVPQFKGYSTDNAGKAALDEFNLKTGKLEHRYPLAATGVFLSALALAPDGTIYAADGVNRVIYSVNNGKLAEVVANPHLTAIRALAVGGDGKLLYLADPQIGIVGYDLSTHKGFALAYNPAALVLPGIVDMVTYDGTLVVVEPGMHPPRVMRLSLSKDGRQVTKVMPIDVANPAFKALGSATAVGHEVYFIANNQQAAYDRNGLLRAGVKLAPLTVFASNMRFSWNQSGINMGMHEIGKSKPGTVSALKGPAWLKHAPANKPQAAAPAKGSTGG